MNPLVPNFLDIFSLIAGTTMAGAVLAIPIALYMVWRKRRKASAVN